MNKRVLQASLALIMFTILAMYIAKFFFPLEFVFVVENPRLIAIGNYVDTHKWAYYPATFGFCFLTYWLFICAACRKQFLNKKELWITVLVILVSYLFSGIVPEMSSYIDIACMLLLCNWFKANIKNYTVVFSIHTINSLLLANARIMHQNMGMADSASVFLIGLESIFWLIILYLISNNKEEGLQWENFFHLSLEKAKTFMSKRFLKQNAK